MQRHTLLCLKGRQEKRLINACRWASNYGLYNYPAIEEILKNRQDELPLEEEVQDEETGMTYPRKHTRKRIL